MRSPVKILLVEDNEGDIILTLEALSEAKVTNAVDVIRDGEAALQYLRREGEYKDSETPDLILLDINLPRIDGMEVLAEIKNDPSLSLIPTVILTTSDSETDIIKSYQQHANCFICKPLDFQKFIEVISSIKHFWVDIVKLPNKTI